MKKKSKSKLIILLSAMVSTFFLGGCAIRESLDDILAKYDLTARVTYYSNGGAFDGTPDIKDIYYKEGALALDIGNEDIKVNSGTATISRSKFMLTGWYYAVDENKDGEPDYADANKDGIPDCQVDTDKDGTPDYLDKDADGDGIEDKERVTIENVYKLGEAVDFSKPLQAGDHWQIIAGWQPDVKVQVLLCSPDLAEGETITVHSKDDTGASYKNGDVIETRIYDKDTGKLGKKDAPFTAKNRSFTFLEYYMDKDCTTPVQWPLERAEGQEKDTLIYAKYIKGDWEVVSSVSDVKDMFGGLTTTIRYWLLNDIDMGGETITLSQNMTNCEIRGNNYTISNLKVLKTSLQKGKIGLFGDISASAKLTDFTVSDLELTYRLLPTTTLSLYFAFSSLAEGATVQNVNLKGSWVIEKEPGWAIQNMIGDSDFTNCLYGGYATDNEYSDNVSNGFKINDGAEPVTFITIKSM